MSKVAVVRCDDYNDVNVFKAMERALALLGGMETFIKAGEKILLKPNILAPALPEKCVTTHPAVFRAAAQIARSAKTELSYGDSPAFHPMETAAKKSGLYDEAVALSIPAADFSNGVKVHYQDGKQNKHFTIAKGVMDSDGLISICKLKTHGFVKYTGAVKNQFGCIPGMLKGEFHLKIPDADNFARMLLDLNAFINPRLYIIDGIMAMEGNGPNGGDPVKLGVLIVSDDPVAADTIACYIMNIDPALVPTVRLGGELGYGKSDIKNITLLGDHPNLFVRLPFKIDRNPIVSLKTKGIKGFIGNKLIKKPVIHKKLCTKCGTCIKMCPVHPKAVNWPSGNTKSIPLYDYNICIRCCCCHEVCPEHAITLKRPLARKLLSGVSETLS
ncbi:MAG: DUF362 domain-containing protein [Leptospirales bacterium]|nr:DUF362 domain-containing protein [Leptospirales bacterium]